MIERLRLLLEALRRRPAPPRPHGERVWNAPTDDYRIRIGAEHDRN